jgi:serine/threonine-protein kinase
MTEPQAPSSPSYITDSTIPPEATVLEPAAATVVPAEQRYTKKKEHSRGGLGIIYLAHDRELNRDVALKEMKTEIAQDQPLRTRFLFEAEVTGRLQHPGVVPVYGKGTYPDGQPFYAMRFIDEEDLEAALKRFHAQWKVVPAQAYRSMEMQQFLRGFLAACHAVAYAHSRGVLHRDLKPKNIMLGPYGETLVMDWGLAKTGVQSDEEPSAQQLIEPDVTGGLSPTQAGRVLGTLPYASPEQAAGKLDRLGPPTDVYGLGATLYCLLTGDAPFPKADAESLREQVCQGKFPSPRQVQVHVPPALEAICLKAMRLNPAERYVSLLELSADIEHWLADEPVSVYAEPWPVRAGRWMRKHRALVGSTVAGMVLALVFLATLALLIQSQKGELARKNLVLAEANSRERAAAELAQKTIEDMTSQDALKFLETQKELRPEQRKFLERALEYYRKYASTLVIAENERARHAEAYFRMGYLQVRLGLHEAARDSYAAAIVESELLVDEHPLVPEHRQALATSHHSLGRVLADLGKNDEAERKYRAALKEQERLAAEVPQVHEYRRALAMSHNSLGSLLCVLGKRDEALRENRAALKEQERLAAEVPRVPEYRRELAGSHNNLGNLLDDLGKRDEAEREYRAALREHERLATEDPQVPDYRQELAISHTNLGRLSANLGKRDEAEREYRAALKEQERLVDEHPQVPEYRKGLAKSHNNLGILLEALGKRDEVEREFRAALKQQEWLATEHPQVPKYRQELAGSHNNLGRVLASLGNGGEAEREYRAALRQQERLVDEHPQVPQCRRDLASSHNGLGILLWDLGKRDEAEREFRAALKERERLAAEHPNVTQYHQDLAASHNNLGRVLASLGNGDVAEREYRAALKEQERLAAEHPHMPEYRQEFAGSHNNLGNLLANLGKRDDAEREYRAALKEQERLVAQHPSVPDFQIGLAVTLGNMARLRNAVKDWGGARRILEQARPHYEAALKTNAQHVNYRRFYRNSLDSLSISLLGLSDHAAAAVTARKLVELDFEPSGDRYDAACIFSRCVPLAEKDTRLSEARRKELVKTYADQAMDLLREAVAKGYKDAAHAKKDTDLDPIRNREDFKKLIGELEAKKK